jgi:myo-inositol-1(or 4)-monophosphatase
MGSIAYTLAMVAAGQADGTLNLDRLNEWDIAAGVLLVEEAGGSAVDKDGHVFFFNQATTSVRGVVGAAATAMDEMQMLVRTLR